ncbi:MAG TPA: FCD domain-containing protein [Beijerinckiaceae bacterium]|jgi:DNA-binding FadR family transcriptional regulator
MNQSRIGPRSEPGGSAAALVRLRRMLDEGPGEGRLPPERLLAQELALSRGALRRALDVLASEGRIVRVQGKGTFVGPPPALPSREIGALQGRTNPPEVMEVRRELEPVLARLAALRATGADIDTMRRFARRTAEAGDADARELWDGALHRRIAEAAGNALLLALFDLVDRVRQDPAWRSLRERARSAARLTAYVEEHERLIAAIADRDAAAAEAAMRDHLAHVAEGLVLAMTGAARPASRSGESLGLAATL